MAENEKLAVGTRGRGRPDNAQVITTVFLLEDLHERATKHPLVREKAAAAVRWGLFEAGGLKESKFAKSVEHIGDTGPQK